MRLSFWNDLNHVIRKLFSRAVIDGGISQNLCPSHFTTKSNRTNIRKDVLIKGEVCHFLSH